MSFFRRFADSPVASGSPYDPNAALSGQVAALALQLEEGLSIKVFESDPEGTGSKTWINSTDGILKVRDSNGGIYSLAVSYAPPPTPPSAYVYLGGDGLRVAASGAQTLYPGLLSGYRGGSGLRAKREGAQLLYPGPLAGYRGGDALRALSLNDQKLYPLT